MQAVLLKITVCPMKVFLNKVEIVLINYTHDFLVLIGLIQVNKIRFFSNVTNVYYKFFIPAFARSLAASYFEVGLIVSICSAATLLSSYTKSLYISTVCVQCCLEVSNFQLRFFFPDFRLQGNNLRSCRSDHLCFLFYKFLEISLRHRTAEIYNILA
jgi:hypothetical protein